jgi:hypothetical protein
MSILGAVATSQGADNADDLTALFEASVDERLINQV